MLNTQPSIKFLDVATIQERIDDVGAVERRLDDDPADPIAAAHLEDLHRTNGEWDKLIPILLDRAENVADSACAAEILREVAEIFSQELDEPHAALDVLQTAFSQDPGSKAIADALDQVAYKTGRMEEVIDAYVLAAAMQEAGTASVASDLWLRIACGHVVSTRDMEAVNDALERVHRLDAEQVKEYLDMVERSATSLEILETLTLVCERIEDWQRMLRVLSRALSMSGRVSERARYHHRIGELNQSLGEEDTAEWHYAESLRLDPTRAITREALSKIYKARGEHRRVAELLDESRVVSDDVEARGHLAFEAAAIYANELDEHTRAIDLYAATLAVAPDHVGAALPVAERYWEQERWTELEGVLDILIARVAELPHTAPPPVELNYRAGHAASQLGKFAKARRHYEDALEIDSIHLPSLYGCAEAYFQLADWQAAYDTFNAVLVVERGLEKGPKYLVETLYNMGRVREASGDRESAVTLFENALDMGLHHPKALEAVTRLYNELEDWDAVANIKRNQIENTEGKERVALLIDLAAMTTRKLGDPQRGIDLYLEALKIDAENRQCLHQLVELYSAAELWEESVETICDIARLEKDPIKRGKYYQAAGTVCRHHIDTNMAVEYLNDALDAFFNESPEIPAGLRAGCFKAFADIGRVLYAVGDWKTLERNYRAMIKRLEPGAPELAELWHGLGQVYRKHLGHRESAIGSFEIASQLDEDRLTHHRILIDLYRDAGPDQIDKAIERRYKLAQAEPTNAEHYSALRSLWTRQREADKAFCACRALVFLGKADAKELDYFNTHRPKQIAWPQVPLTEEMWNRLRHPSENQRISAVLGIVSEVVALETAASAKRLGIQDDESPAYNHLRHMFSSVVFAMGTRAPSVFVQPELGGDVLLANIVERGALTPGFVLGRGLYQNQGPHAIVHTLARTLTYTRPSYYLRLALPTHAELESAFLAASSLTRSDVPVPAALATWVQAYVSSLNKRLHPAWHSQLAQAVNAFVSEGKSYDLEEWGHSVDMTARRVGLLLSGDLQTAVKGISKEPLFTAGPNHDDKVADLLLHSISQEHLSVRRDLGIHLE